MLSNPLTLILAGLKDELLAAQVEADSIKTQLEGEVALNGRLRTAMHLVTSYAIFELR